MTEAISSYRRSEKDLAVRLLCAMNVCYARVYQHLTVRQPCRLPAQGPAILVCNHTSSLDPLLIQSASPRLIRWMMAREYFDIRGLSWVYRTVGAIPVERDARDLTATRMALRALDEGYILGVFPEGKIEPTRELLPFQSGIALMALKSGVDVYPACLDGTQRGKSMVDSILKPNEATLTFGPPLKLVRPRDGKIDLEATTQQIRGAVKSLQ